MSILIVCAFCVFACNDEKLTPVIPLDPTTHGPTIDDLVLANCLLVQAAAEAWANDHGGEYPDYPSSWTDPSQKFIEYFPDSALLTNPVTGQRTEPVWKEPTGMGSTSYQAFGLLEVEHWHMRCAGYVIIGRGEEGDTTITNLPDRTDGRRCGNSGSNWI